MYFLFCFAALCVMVWDDLFFGFQIGVVWRSHSSCHDLHS